jgi:hypothetical protein
MKTILLAAALALTATTASASAVKLPKEYLGSWCITNVAKDGLGQDTITHERCDMGPERTFISPNSLDSFASPVGECFQLLNGKRSPQHETFRGKRYHTFFMTYQCRGGKLTAELSVEGDALFIWIIRSGQ